MIQVAKHTVLERTRFLWLSFSVDPKGAANDVTGDNGEKLKERSEVCE